MFVGQQVVMCSLHRLSEFSSRLVSKRVFSPYWGLTPSQIGDKIEKHCRSPADFLRIVLGSVAQLQGADRWIESTPESGLYLSKFYEIFRVPMLFT